MLKPILPHPASSIHLPQVVTLISMEESMLEGMRWHMPVISALKEAEVGRSL